MKNPINTANHIDVKISGKWFRVDKNTGEKFELSSDYVALIDKEFRKSCLAKIRRLKKFLQFNRP